WDGMQYKTLISTNGTDYTQDMYLVGTQRPYPRTIFIGGCSGSAIAHTPHPFFGTINMNKSYLSTRGQVIWQGMDDAGLATRADISLSNLDELGEKRFNDKQDKLTAGENITIENNVISASGGGSYHPPILSSVWSDHLINDIQWLRADTFSWQSGDVYVTAYNTLVEEYATGTEETEGNITFRRSSNGFKIATSDMESAILTKYNSEGIAWYYILDTTNKQFKLPRTKWGYKGLRDTVGNDVGESLPNIEGKIDNSAVSEGWTGVFATSGSYSSSPIATTSSSTVKRGRIDFNASNSSSTYQDNAPVQERATQMYLYFYVGEYAREAIEQTAGLNVDLFNNKLDLNASNLSTQGMSYISGLGIPSDRYIELSVGASYSTYTAPANGWVCLYASNTSNANATVTIKNGKMTTISHGSNGEWDCATICPVRKNDTYSIIYTNVNNWKGRYFIYAQGEQ
ncbi:MAG: hypothetical protein KBT03_08805, partial [Bacteroidales bacterium]|nr:hypothetical protein [Candidatus Scybalousia scybalohippi]